ncbi:MAG: fumarylacetoacetate hydrolase family protein [Acetobacteraceae bacterium]|nr:fumarylacetoacetate hydrolase family protein [Acetobacteraceae bacterium]
MKIGFFNDFRLGVIKHDSTGAGSIVDVTDAVADIARIGPHDLINGVIASWATSRGKLEAASAGAGVALASVTLRAPLPKPGNIVCMAVNYMEDGTRSEPAIINAFHKASTAVIGHGGTMVLPDVSAVVFEGEAELGLVIGKPTSHVSQAAAMGHVFGYLNFIDGSARGLASAGFFAMKSRDSFAPMGPWITTADEIADPQNLAVRLWVNGVLKQNFNTNDMGHKIARCIEWVSSIHALQPGDVLATGTNHRGLGAFQHGDNVELEVAGCGRLAIKVTDALGRTWNKQTRLERVTAGLTPDTAPQLSGKYFAS